MKRYFFVFIYIVVSGTLFFCFDSVQALTIFPVRQTLIADPGTIEKVYMNVKNEENVPVVVKPEVDAFAIDQTGKAVFGASDEAKKWVEVSPRSFTLLPGKSIDVQFLFRVPQSSPPASHYLGLFATLGGEGGQIGLNSRVGSLLFLYTSGNIEESVELLDFSFENKVFFSDPLKVFLQIRNTGNIHVVPQGEVVVKNWRGKELFRKNINTEKSLLVPERKFNDESVIDHLSWKDAGPIRTEAVVQYGVKGGRVAVSDTSWFLPKEFLIVGGIIFVGVVSTGVFFFFRRRTPYDV